MLRRISAFFVVTLLLFDLFGYMLINVAYDCILKHEFLLKSVNENNFADISRISIHKINDKHKLRFEDEMEFEFNGKMYDVIKIVEATDSIHYFCYSDIKETILKRNFNSISENKAEANSRVLVQMLGNNIFTKIFPELIIIEPETDSNHFGNELLIKYLSNLHDIPSPPPKKLIS